MILEALSQFNMSEIPIDFLELKSQGHNFYSLQMKACLSGGKGGFGSLLRSINPKKQANISNDACRDLTTGRRLG